jgi:translation initiation factor IF-2
MSTVTVQDFAAELNRPVAELLAQFKEAGVAVKNEKSVITASNKQALLSFLQQKGRGALSAAAGGEPKRSITLKRKETSELKLGGGRGAPSKTVSVEVRKRRTYVKQDGLEQETTPATAEEVAPVEPVRDIEAEKAAAQAAARLASIEAAQKIQDAEEQTRREMEELE